MSEEVTEALAPTDETPVVETEAVEALPAETTEEAPQENRGKERLAARFSELTAKIRQAEERAAVAEAALRIRYEAPEPAQQDEYADPDDIEARIERAVQQREQKAANEAAQKAHAEKAQSLQAKLFESGLEGAVMIASGANIAFTQEMVDALAVSEQAAVVADHLGRNPQESARIAALPAHLQGYELAHLEQRLASQPKTTNAAPPPPIVGARGNPATGQRDDLPIEDWMRLEREKHTRVR